MAEQVFSEPPVFPGVVQAGSHYMARQASAGSPLINNAPVLLEREKQEARGFVASRIRASVPDALFLFNFKASLPVLFLLLGPVALWALPPFIPIEKRARESQIVIVADVVSSKSQNLNQTFDSAEVHLHVIRVLKSPEKVTIPADLGLQFAVYPESFEARMRTPPAEGRYFVFLNTATYLGESGNHPLLLFRLYEPNPFAFDLWNKKSEMKLIQFLKEETP